MNQKRILAFPKNGWIFALLVAVAYIAYGLFYVPGLYMDDWAQGTERLIVGNAHWLDFTNRRPLLLAPFLAQYHLFGLNITAFYVVLWALHILLAILLYRIAHHFTFLQRYSFDLIIALLFFIYPTTYTNMWLTMIHGYSAFGLTLLYAYLLLRFADGDHWLYGGLAVGCLLLALGLYEGQIGIASSWALILLVTQPRIPLKRRLGLLSPLLLIGAFTLWRTVGYQAVGIRDEYFSHLVMTPGILLFRLLLGYKISLVWGWTTTIQYLMPTASKLISAFGVLLVALCLLWWLLSWITARFLDPKQKFGRVNVWSLRQRGQAIWPYLGLSMLGLVLIGVGYIPTIAVFLPNLSTYGSRFNMFATIGAALVTAACLMIGALVFARNQAQSKTLFLATAVPFIILGIVTQAAVQFDNKLAWQEQQQIWQALFSVAPNFKDHTMVLFVLPGYQERAGYQSWQRTPLSAAWEASSAIRLLYNNATLSADVIFPDIVEPTEPVLSDKGVLTQDTRILTPYIQAVVFVYEPDAHKMRQLEKLPPELVKGVGAPIKLCTNCILSAEALNVPLRRLVEN